MAISEMGSHGRNLLVCHSFVENTMAGTFVASFGFHIFGSCFDQRHDDVPSLGMLQTRVSKEESGNINGE